MVEALEVSTALKDTAGAVMGCRDGAVMGYRDGAVMRCKDGVSNG